MSLDQKFQQRWEIRKNGDEIDSSSDDSRSNSSDEAARKKHKLVSKLISTDNGEDYDNLRSQDKSQFDTTMMVNFNLPEARGKRIQSSKKKNAVKRKIRKDTVKGNKQRKKKCGVQETLLDDLKIFAESMIAEVRDAREKIFVQMKEELAKLAADGSMVRARRKKEVKNRVRTPQIRMKSSAKNQDCSGVTVEQCGKRKMALDSKNNSKAIEDHVNIDRAKGERSISPIQKGTGLANVSDHLVSSSYSTLPSVLSRPQVSHQRTGLYSRNHIPPGVAINSSSSNQNMRNSVIGTNIHHGYLMNIQPDEQFGSIVPFSSQDLSLFDRHSTQASNMGTGFPVPLHQELNSNFNMPSQILLEDPSRENNRMSLRTNAKATKFSQGSHALEERFVANCISNQMNYKSDGAVLPYKSEDLGAGHFHSN